MEVHSQTLPVGRAEELHHALGEGAHLFVGEEAIRRSELVEGDGLVFDLLLILVLGLTDTTAVVVLYPFDDFVHEALLRPDVHREGEVKEALAGLHRSIGSEEGRRLPAFELALGAVPKFDVQEEATCLGELIVALDADGLGVGEEGVELLPILVFRALGG